MSTKPATIPTADCQDQVSAWQRIKVGKVLLGLESLGRGVRDLQECSRGEQFSLTERSAPLLRWLRLRPDLGLVDSNLKCNCPNALYREAVTSRSPGLRAKRATLGSLRMT